MKLLALSIVFTAALLVSVRAVTGSPALVTVCVVSDGGKQQYAGIVPSNPPALYGSDQVQGSTPLLIYCKSVSTGNVIPTFVGALAAWRFDGNGNVLQGNPEKTSLGCWIVQGVPQYASSETYVVNQLFDAQIREMDY